MVTILLSETYPNYFYIRYQGAISSADDEAFCTSILVPYLKKNRHVSLIMEYQEVTEILDDEFFNSSKIDIYDPNHSIIETVSFGLVGIQKSFIRTYISNFPHKEVQHLILKDKSEFEQKYKLNVENDFSVTFTK